MTRAPLTRAMAQVRLSRLRGCQLLTVEHGNCRAMSIAVADGLLRVSYRAQDACDVLEKFDANPVFGREKDSDITIEDALDIN